VAAECEPRMRGADPGPRPLFQHASTVAEASPAGQVTLAGRLKDRFLGLFRTSYGAIQLQGSVADSMQSR
jgi:hypothetical protein